MTKDKYLEVCKQLGTEPKAKNCPPGLEDFPDLMRDAIDTFNRLGDRVYPEIGYVGKDYSLLDYYIDICGVNNSYDLEFFLDVLSWLDSRAIQKNAETVKREMDKLKRKSHGK
jgi:hypothetical protein